MEGKNKKCSLSISVWIFPSAFALSRKVGAKWRDSRTAKPVMYMYWRITVECYVTESFDIHLHPGACYDRNQPTSHNADWGVSCERAFSKMKIFKNSLRSSMSKLIARSIFEAVMREKVSRSNSKNWLDIALCVNNQALNYRALSYNTADIKNNLEFILIWFCLISLVFLSTFSNQKLSSLFHR